MRPVTRPKSIWFPNWISALSTLPLKELEQAAYRRAIASYLRFCKQSRQRATVASARQFMDQIEGQRRLGVSQLASWKAALNWFFQAGAHPVPPVAGGRALTPPHQPALLDSKVPPLAATDLGGPEWERQLIRELRNRHYQWRTEQAYRMWAGRFAQWLHSQRRHGGNVFAAEETEVRDFLSDLATRQRVAVATQRQALGMVEG